MGPQREDRKVTDTDDLDAAMLAVSTAPPRGPVDRRGPLRRRWRQRVPAAPAAHLGRADGPRLVFEPGRIGRDRHPKMMRARFSWLLLTVALLLVVAGGNTPRNAVTAPHPTPHIPGGPNSGVAPVQSRPSKTRSRPYAAHRPGDSPTPPWRTRSRDTRTCWAQGRPAGSSSWCPPRRGGSGPTPTGSVATGGRVGRSGLPGRSVVTSSDALR
jgi:hypothetical protein